MNEKVVRELEFNLIHVLNGIEFLVIIDNENVYVFVSARSLESTRIRNVAQSGLIWEQLQRNPREWLIIEFDVEQL